MNRKAHGFTIVELLIVIVVIAILAAISIAAYANIQQRAKNTAIINAASQSLKMIQAYIAANGTYPLTIPTSSISSCVTKDIACKQESTATSVVNSSFKANMNTVGTLPSSIPIVDDDKAGIMYWYTATRTMNGESQPAILVYFLIGTNQQCGVPGVALQSPDSNTLVSSSTGYTRNSGTNATMCRVSIPGPVHL